MVLEVKLDQLRQSWRPTQGLLLLSSTTSMFMVLPQTTSVAKVPSHQDILVPGPADPTDWLLHSGSTVCSWLSLRDPQTGFSNTNYLQRCCSFVQAAKGNVCF